MLYPSFQTPLSLSLRTNSKKTRKIFHVNIKEYPKSGTCYSLAVISKNRYSNFKTNYTVLRYAVYVLCPRY